MMEVRAERSGDEQAISALITAAFLEAEHTGGNEAEIVAALRKLGNLTVSLVAHDNAAVIGHVAFSPVTIDGNNEGWFGLGPVAVDPPHQRKGIGAAIIRDGLEILRTQGAKGCVVLGDPRYYARFGFAADPRFRLAGVPPEYFQRLAFVGQAGLGGNVAYCPAFGG